MRPEVVGTVGVAIAGDGEVPTTRGVVAAGAAPAAYSGLVSQPARLKAARTRRATLHLAMAMSWRSQGT
jgi:hypothetical protein